METKTRQTGENLNTLIDGVSHQHGILKENIHSVTDDNGANMLKIRDSFPSTRLPHWPRLFFVSGSHFELNDPKQLPFSTNFHVYETFRFEKMRRKILIKNQPAAFFFYTIC